MRFDGLAHTRVGEGQLLRVHDCDTRRHEAVRDEFDHGSRSFVLQRVHQRTQNDTVVAGLVVQTVGGVGSVALDALGERAADSGGGQDDLRVGHRAVEQADESVLKESTRLALTGDRTVELVLVATR